MKTNIRKEDWADAQADLNLRWTHMPLCWVCHDAAHIYNVFKMTSGVNSYTFFKNSSYSLFRLHDPKAHKLIKRL